MAKELNENVKIAEKSIRELKDFIEIEKIKGKITLLDNYARLCVVTDEILTKVIDNVQKIKEA